MVSFEDSPFFPASLLVIHSKRLRVQVVERLLSLPADYWSQFVASAASSEQPDADHLIIENSNCYATPERSETSTRLGPSLRSSGCLTCVVSFQ